MNAMRRLAKRLRASLSGRQDDDRLREELAEHLELLTEEYAQAGVPLDEARRRARAEARRRRCDHGGLARPAAAALAGGSLERPALRPAHAAAQPRLLGSRDAHAGTRHRREPRDLRARLRGADPPAAVSRSRRADARAPALADRDAPGVFEKMCLVVPEVSSPAERQHVFSGTALFARREWSLTNAGGPERLQGEIVGASYFALLGVETPLGRTFGAEDWPGAPPSR